MNYRMIARILGLVLLIEAALMLLPMAAGFWFGENALNFVICLLITGAAGFALTRVKVRSKEIFAKDGMTVVGLAWVIMSLFGALPFVLNGDIPNYIDALFETVSGFTTTGASTVAYVEQMSHGGLFWRSFTHWVGGMGVLVFIMAVLPMNGEHSMHIMRAEVPGPTVGKLVPRAKKTAMILYLIYTGLTLAETIMLMFGGMSFFDALLHAFATAGTGGFSTKAASIGAFNSAYIEMVVAAFLVLFGTNFNLYYLVLIGRAKDALKSEELHWYFAIIAVATVAIALGITKMYDGFAQALRYAFFNVMTITSTAGFSTADFTLWPAYTQALIVLLMFIGSCAGSTGGGIKVSRIILLIKNEAGAVSQVISPREVKGVRMDGKRVDDKTIKAVSSFAVTYFGVLLLCMAIISFDGFDFTTNFTAALSCISNVGPGLSAVGPAGNFCGFSSFSKIVMSFTMLVGRLEIYPILILLLPTAWRRRR